MSMERNYEHELKSGMGYTTSHTCQSYTCDIQLVEKDIMRDRGEGATNSCG